MKMSTKSLPKYVTSQPFLNILFNSDSLSSNPAVIIHHLYKYQVGPVIANIKNSSEEQKRQIELQSHFVIIRHPLKIESDHLSKMKTNHKYFLKNIMLKNYYIKSLNRFKITEFESWLKYATSQHFPHIV